MKAVGLRSCRVVGGGVGAKVDACVDSGFVVAGLAVLYNAFVVCGHKLWSSAEAGYVVCSGRVAVRGQSWNSIEDFCF